MKKILFYTTLLFTFYGCGEIEMSENPVAPNKPNAPSSIQRNPINYTEAWVKNFGDDFFGLKNTNITEDKQNHFYFTGTSIEGNILIAKFNKEGQLLWKKILESKNYERSGGITLDTKGNIYIVGSTTDSSENYDKKDILIIALSSKGAELWRKEYGVEGTEDYASEITFDKQNRKLYIIGMTNNDLENQISVGGIDTFISQFSLDGQLLWTKIMGTVYDDYASNISLDKNGNIYIAGSSSGAGESFLSKYNDQGKQQWLKNYKIDTLFEYAMFMSLGEDNNFYMSGKIIGESKKIVGENDIFIRKINLDGQLVWDKIYGTKKSENPLELKANKNGELFVTGSTYGSFNDFNNSKNNSKVFVSSFDEDANELWTKQYEGNGVQASHRYHISLDNDALYIMGEGEIDISNNPSQNQKQAFGSEYGLFMLKLKAQ